MNLTFHGQRKIFIFTGMKIIHVMKILKIFYQTLHLKIKIPHSKSALSRDCKEILKGRKNE